MKYNQAQIDALGQIYVEKDTTVDNLAQDGAALASISTELHRRTGAELTPPQTLDALLYARKRGMLPRLRRRPR